MYKTSPLLIEKCRTLRKRGFTLGEIVRDTKLPKTTIYGHVQNIPLSSEARERLKKIRQRIIKENARKINRFNVKYRKGKCIPGRIVPKPDGWTDGLLYLTSHFMFDGEIQTHSCIYHNRNETLIERVRILMEKIFRLQPRKWLNQDTGVHRISYHYVELADYLKRKVEELKKNIKTASLSEKIIFLKSFFDDEGSIHFDKKIVRGFQHNLEILKLVQALLKDFNIESKIDEKYQEIVISRKPNLIKFRDKINFSKGIFINPERKNSIWKRKLEKRKILDYTISSYEK